MEKFIWVTLGQCAFCQTELYVKVKESQFSWDGIVQPNIRVGCRCHHDHHESQATRYISLNQFNMTQNGGEI